MPKSPATPPSTTSTINVLSAVRTKRAKKRTIHRSNHNCKIGLNPKRKDFRRQRKINQRLANIAEQNVRAQKGRGKDIDITTKISIFMLVFSFFIWGPETEECWNESLRGDVKQGIDYSHTAFVNQVVYVKPTDVIAAAAFKLGLDYPYNTLKRCADYVAKKLHENNGNLPALCSGIGSSNRTGRAPTNAKYTDPLVKKWMILANDELLGGGSFQDLATQYNEICKKNKRPDLQGSPKSMWNWCGHFGWQKHRRWIKPLLNEKHMVSKRKMREKDEKRFFLLCMVKIFFVVHNVYSSIYI